jgi:hypothetical protein
MPFGPDCEYEDIDACVAANGDKDDPEAYCATLMEETEESCADGEGAAGAGDGFEGEGPRWQGPVAVEGETTGDGREIEPGAITWDAGPWPLIWDRTEGDHTGMVVGHATRIWRDGNLIMAEGVLAQSEDPETQAAVARVSELLTPDEDDGVPAVGVSVMLDNQDVEIRVRKDLIETEDAEEGDVIVATVDPDTKVEQAAQWLRGALTGGPRAATDVVHDARVAGHAEKTLRRAKEQLGVTSEKGAAGKWTWSLPAGFEHDIDDEDDKGRIIVAKWSASDMAEVTTAGRIRHIALLDTPAFADARIALVASMDLDAYANPAFGVNGDHDPRLVRQESERPGEQVQWGAPLTVTDDGRVYGHAALWGRCHAGFADRCQMPPQDGSYSRFLSAEAVPGLPTGPITVGTTHANLTATPGEAMRHYSDTGRAVADVTVGEDQHGIWVAGRLRPSASAADVAALRGSSLSGDWRWLGGRLRLVGLLAVNQPGFLVERQLAASIDFDDAAGQLTFGPCDCDESGPEWTVAEVQVATHPDTGEFVEDRHVLAFKLQPAAWLDEPIDLHESTDALLVVRDGNDTLVFESRRDVEPPPAVENTDGVDELRAKVDELEEIVASLMRQGLD